MWHYLIELYYSWMSTETKSVYSLTLLYRTTLWLDLDLVSSNVRHLKRFPDLHNFTSASPSFKPWPDQISRTNEAASGDNLDGPISYFASTHILGLGLGHNNIWTQNIFNYSLRINMFCPLILILVVIIAFLRKIKFVIIIICCHVSESYLHPIFKRF